MKTCTLCHRSLPLESFYVVHRHGLSETLTRCKECVSNYHKNRRKDPRVAALERDQRVLRYMQGTRAKVWSVLTKAEKRARYEKVKTWRRNHPEHRHSAALARRLNRSHAFRAAWPIIVAHYGGHCLGSGCTDHPCADHVVPLTPNCSTDLNQLVNLQPLCRRCNTIKGQFPNPGGEDYRPDKGAWIAELVKRNPGLHIDHTVTAGHQHQELKLPLALPK